MKYNILFLLLILSISSCVESDDGLVGHPLTITGLKPIYIDADKAMVIETTTPQPIVRLGKIYYKDKTIYVNESNMGVHVIDNTDPLNPVKTKFINIPGCNDIAIKGNIMYADNVGDLIAIDISNVDQPKVVKRLPNAQSLGEGGFPQFYEGYFECVDDDLGVVVGWEEVLLDDPKCWR